MPRQGMGIQDRVLISLSCRVCFHPHDARKSGTSQEFRHKLNNGRFGGGIGVLSVRLHQNDQNPRGVPRGFHSGLGKRDGHRLGRPFPSSVLIQPFTSWPVPWDVPFPFSPVPRTSACSRRTVGRASLPSPVARKKRGDPPQTKVGRIPHSVSRFDPLNPLGQNSEPRFPKLTACWKETPSTMRKTGAPRKGDQLSYRHFAETT